MKPYYDHAGITLYNGDCQSILASLGAESITAVVTDPPYGISYRSNNYKNGNPFDAMRSDDITNAAWLCLITPLICTGGAIYCFSRWDVVGVWKMLFEFFGLRVNNCLVWDKTQTGMGDLKGAYGPTHEIILFASRGAHLLRRGRPSDIIRCQRVGSKRDHPTEKPPSIMSELILNSSDPGDMILDPFSGVGPVLVAAASTGRRAIGIEISERYCEIAATRLSHAVLPLEATA